MVEILSPIQNAIEIISKLNSLSKKVQNAEINLLLADLSNELANAKLEAVELKSQLFDAKTEIEQLKSIVTTPTDVNQRVREIDLAHCKFTLWPDKTHIF